MNALDNSLSLLLGNGDGNFQNQIVYTVGYNPISVTAGDFNNDTKLDLAVVNHYDNAVSILLNSCL